MGETLAVLSSDPLVGLVSQEFVSTVLIMLAGGSNVVRDIILLVIKIIQGVV